MAKRRANGEGNIRKRADGRWEGRYTAGRDGDGKPIGKNVLGKTQAEVREKLRVAIEQAKVVDAARAGEYTLAGWLSFWLDNYAKPAVRPATLESYSGYLKNQIKPHIGDTPLEKLTTRDLQQFYNLLATSGRVQRKESQNQPAGLNPKTIRNLHNFLRQALEQAVTERLLAANPATGCVLARAERTEMKTLSNLLGHYSAGFTLDTYGHVSGGMKEDAARKIQQGLPL